MSDVKLNILDIRQTLIISDIPSVFIVQYGEICGGEIEWGPVTTAILSQKFPFIQDSSGNTFLHTDEKGEDLKFILTRRREDSPDIFMKIIGHDSAEGSAFIESIREKAMNQYALTGNEMKLFLRS